MPETPAAALDVRPGGAAPEEPLEKVMFPDLPAVPDDAVSLLQEKLGANERLVSARAKAHALIALKQQGYSRRQIAEALGMKENAVKVALYRARTAGRLNDLRSVLEHDSAALAVDSLNFHLRKKDKDATFKTLEGLGHFRSYNNTKNDGMPAGSQMVALNVNVRVINAPGEAPADPLTIDVTPNAVGVPRED